MHCCIFDYRILLESRKHFSQVSCILFRLFLAPSEEYHATINTLPKVFHMISTMANQRSNSKLVKNRRACRLECMSTKHQYYAYDDIKQKNIKNKKKTKGSRAQIQAPPTLGIVPVNQCEHETQHSRECLPTSSH